MLSKKWDTLPFEILQLVFQFSSNGPDNHKASFNEYQLVCRNWNRAAQEALYENICLTEDIAKDFISTINNRNTSLGTLVKKITFCDGFAKLLDNTKTVLDVIIARCPGIVELCAIDQNEINIVWDYLAPGRSRLQDLELLTRCKEQTQKFIPLTASAPRKSKEMTTHTPLLQYSLGHLCIVSFHSNRLQDLDLMIDSCCEAVGSLEFDSLLLPQSLTSMQMFKKNKCVKRICIGYANIPAYCFEYFTNKFSSLQDVQISGLSHFLAPDEELAWWIQLGKLFSHLTKYNVCVDLARLTMVVVLSRQSESRERRTLTVVASNESLSSYYSQGISLTGSQYDELFEDKVSLTKNCDGVELSLDPFDVNRFDDYTVETQLKLYSPNRISIVVENMDTFYSRFTVNFPEVPLSTETEINRYFAPEAIIYNAKCILARKCNERNWHCFHAAIRLMDKTRDSYLHFDRTVFCEYPAKLSHQDFNIAELRFSNSIISSSVLPYFSERLTAVNKLVIDTCSILMEKQHKLHIFLPNTTVKGFHLKIAPFRNATKCEYDPYQTCILENNDLLNAAREGGCLKFKIETDSGVYLFLKKGSHLCNLRPQSYHSELSTRAFLIWIKCRDLNELVFEGDGESSLTWKKPMSATFA
ncbi:hypothetical protein [Parasitella parasitica]|uniref:Uncharacterized protein n=1 Tax=Parasitella parasitica TaxID=35722 RepID=A0A0B7NE71_9FUNG|nr:hypothetical protein [Parasitella parasitica]